MAMRVQPLNIGVDVSKDELVICRADQEALVSIDNGPKAIAAWLKTLPGPARIAVEATNVFHLELIEQAHRRGHEVFVIDGYRLNRYRESIGGRAKTDACDARLLLRYLDREGQDLRPWSPPPKAYRALQRLINRRATLVRTRVTLEQSLGALKELRASVQALLRQLKKLDKMIQQRILKALRHHGWHDHFRRIMAIEGIGPITAAAVIMAFHRGRFRSSDAFIAFLGLDVQVRESGKYKGRRKLTKQGAPELRRLLYLAAMTACRSPAWQAFYQRHLDRGLSTTQALVVLARKLARIAYTLLKNESQYQPRIHPEGCMAT